jgi:hypothetical protein
MREPGAVTVTVPEAVSVVDPPVEDWPEPPDEDEIDPVLEDESEPLGEDEAEPPAGGGAPVEVAIDCRQITVAEAVSVSTVATTVVVPAALHVT